MDNMKSTSSVIEKEPIKLEDFYNQLETGLTEAGVPFLDPNDFKIEGTLGSGAFGEVYKAIYSKDNKEYAIKKMIKQPEELVKQDLKNLLREIVAYNKFDHPQILKFHGVYFKDKLFHIVMVLIVGTDFSMYLQAKHKDLSLKEKLDLTIQLAEILTYVHKQCVIHRDLKPDNLMIDDIDKKLTLIDFGLAKHNNNMVSQETVSKSGTPGYEPPENYFPEGDDEDDEKYKVSVKFDVWSLGCIIFEIFDHFKKFGPPYGRDDGKIIVAYRKMKEPTYNKHLIHNGVQLTGIIEIVEKCLMYKSSDRITSEEVLNLLKALVGTENYS